MSLTVSRNNPVDPVEAYKGAYGSVSGVEQDRLRLPTKGTHFGSGAPIANPATPVGASSSGGSDWRAIWSQYNQQSLPQQSALDYQRALQMGQINDVRALQGLRRQAATAGAGFGMRGLDIDAAELAATRGDVGTDRDLALQLLNYNLEDLDQAARRADESLGRGRRRAFSDVTTRGAWHTPGFESDLGELQRDWELSMQDVDIGRRRTGTQGQQIQERARQAERNLTFQAQRLGISREKLQFDLQNGLEQMGLTGIMDVNQLLQGITETDARKAEIYNQVYQSALQYAASRGISPPALTSARNPNPYDPRAPKTYGR